MPTNSSKKSQNIWKMLKYIFGENSKYLWIFVIRLQQNKIIVTSEILISEFEFDELCQNSYKIYCDNLLWILIKWYMKNILRGILY